MDPEFLNALQGPNQPSVEDRLAPFSAFIGSWNVDVTWFQGGAPVRRVPGEWHFAAVLGGRAIQDVWIVPPRSAPDHVSALYEYGTSLRFPDPAGGYWRSTWHGPVQGVVIPFRATPREDSILLEGQHTDNIMLRWLFSDITPDRFLWQNFYSTDNGSSWRIIQEFVATRRRG